MSTRQKKAVLNNVSEADYKEKLAIYAKAEAELRKVNAEIDIQTQKIREKYQSKSDELLKLKEESFEVVMKYAEENPQFFEKKRSMETPFGTIGFRLGTPKLKNIKGFTWASVLTLCEKVMPKFVRTKNELNKEAILADKELSEKDLKGIGVEIVQDDTFFIDLKSEETDI